jgi:hypothetical protein
MSTSSRMSMATPSCTMAGVPVAAMAPISRMPAGVPVCVAGEPVPPRVVPVPCRAMTHVPGRVMAVPAAAVVVMIPARPVRVVIAVPVRGNAPVVVVVRCVVVRVGPGPDIAPGECESRVVAIPAGPPCPRIGSLVVIVVRVPG